MQELTALFKETFSTHATKVRCTHRAMVEGPCWHASGALMRRFSQPAGPRLQAVQQAMFQDTLAIVRLQDRSGHPAFGCPCTRNTQPAICLQGPRFQGEGC